MKVFLDTNILFSAILFPGSMPDEALQKSLSSPYEAVTSIYVLNELKRNFIKKFPNKIDVFETMFDYFVQNIIVVDYPYNIDDLFPSLRDDSDKPILQAAILSNCDLLISGDKDFLDANLKHPKVVTAKDFYLNY